MSSRGEQRGRPKRAHDRGFRVTAGGIAGVGSLLAVAVVIVVIVLGVTRPAHHPPGTPTSSASATHKRTGTSGTLSTPRLGTASVPILVYHVINTQPAGSTTLPALYVPTQQFTAQMQALKAGGWHAVTLNQLEAYWTRGTSLGPGKPIVISFDNGYGSQYVNALPVLKGLGWVGVENLEVTGLPPAEGGMSAAQVRGLVAAGWELDTQGLTHADLATLDPTQLSNQVTAARQTLKSEYGAPVNWFSYPSGDYNATVVAAVQSAGYLGATTVNPGWASPKQNRFQLPALAVVAGTSPSELLTQIATAQSTTSVPASYSGAGLA